MAKIFLDNAIKQAGGRRVVADACGVSIESVRKWIVNGLPRTEWTGETEYSDIIISLVNSNGNKINSNFTSDDIQERSFV